MTHPFACTCAACIRDDDRPGAPMVLAIMAALVALVAVPVWLLIRVVTAHLPH